MTMLTSLAQRALYSGVSTVCRVPAIRAALHPLAVRITRSPRRSALNRARAFNLLAPHTTPHGDVSFSVPIPELPERQLHLRLDLNDDLSRRWYYFGYDYYEVAVRRTMWALLHDLPADHPGNVIDIGANLGYFTLYLGALLSHRGLGHVHSFEPSPGVFARLQRNLALNPRLSVTLNQAAVANSEGMAELFLAAESLGHSAASLIRDGVEQIGAVPVITRTVDCYVMERAVKQVALVKMDCEGAEAAALKGMTAIVARDSPHIILELIPRYDEVSMDLISHPLYQDYRKFLITEEGLIEHRQAYSSYEHRDWLFTLRPPKSLIVRSHG